MSEFCLEFNMDNAAFDGDASIEVSRIFNSVKNQIANGCGDGIVNDVNGNTIGRWYAEIDDDVTSSHIARLRTEHRRQPGPTLKTRIDPVLRNKKKEVNRGSTD